MLRLTDIKLPLDHSGSALRAAILERLGIATDELTGFTVAKRSYDARKRGAIVLIYSVDVETPREAQVLLRMQQALVTIEEELHERLDGHAAACAEILRDTLAVKKKLGQSEGW